MKAFVFKSLSYTFFVYNERNLFAYTLCVKNKMKYCILADINLHVWMIIIVWIGQCLRVNGLILYKQ